MHIDAAAILMKDINAADCTIDFSFAFPAEEVEGDDEEPCDHIPHARRWPGLRPKALKREASSSDALTPRVERARGVIHSGAGKKMKRLAGKGA